MAVRLRLWLGGLGQHGEYKHSSEAEVLEGAAGQESDAGKWSCKSAQGAGEEITATALSGWKRGLLI